MGEQDAEAGIPRLALTNDDAATYILLDTNRQMSGSQPQADLRTEFIYGETIRHDPPNVAAERKTDAIAGDSFYILLVITTRLVERMDSLL